MENNTLKTLEEIQEEFRKRQKEILGEICIDYSKPLEEESKEQLLPEIPPEVAKEDEIQEEETLKDLTEDITLENLEEIQKIKRRSRVSGWITGIIIALCTIALALGVGIYFFAEKIPCSFIDIIAKFIRQYPIYLAVGLLIVIIVNLIFRSVFSFRDGGDEDDEI